MKQTTINAILIILTVTLIMAALKLNKYIQLDWVLIPSPIYVAIFVWIITNDGTNNHDDYY